MEGKHEGIISEALFYDVQDVLAGRKRKKRKRAVKVISHEQFPLRGFLICPKCGRLLTGSASKSARGEYYHYYHCRSFCGVRYRTELVNKAVRKEVHKYKARENIMDIYKTCSQDIYFDVTNGSYRTKKRYLEEIEMLNKKIEEAREKYFDGEADKEDFLAYKKRLNKRINDLERKLTTLTEQNSNHLPKLKQSLFPVSQLDKLYDVLEVDGKRQVISSIYPEKSSV